VKDVDRSLSFRQWYVEIVYGTREGFYRAMAEALGSMFQTVNFLASLVYKMFFLGQSRPRAQSVLDGFAKGMQGMVRDCLSTPTLQLIEQTEHAYHDRGVVVMIIVFLLCCVRVPLGPAIGLLHFVAIVCEGFANALLDEAQQFTPFAPQRFLETPGAQLD